MPTKRDAPTMSDVAKLAGVTAMTVSRALSGNGLVSERTRQKITEAADALGYVFDSTAAVFASGKSGFVAVVVPTLNNSNFADTIRGITEGLSSTRLQVLLSYTDYDAEQEERVIRSLLTRRPEAIVITEGLHTDRSRKLLLGARIPVVEMWGAPTEPVQHVVGFSNREAGARMAEYLLGKGHRKITFVGGDSKRDTRGLERYLGYKQVMEDAGLKARLVKHGKAPIGMRHGEGALARLLTVRADTEAVLCVSDLLAFGMLASCQRQGIDVPGRLAIAGFGNYDVAQHCVPGITTLDFYPRDMGLAIANRVRQLLGHSADSQSTTLLLTDFEVVQRESA